MQTGMIMGEELARGIHCDFVSLAHTLALGSTAKVWLLCWRIAVMAETQFGRCAHALCSYFEANVTWQ